LLTNNVNVEHLAAELEQASVNFPGLGQEQIIRPKLHDVVTHHWKWTDLHRLLLRAAEYQSTLPQGSEGAERRIIRLKNPGIPEETVTDTMSVSVQYLLPGEVARTHRHTPNAFRFFLHGGAFTTVSGERCDMRRGDLIITPFLEWHDHGNDGNEPAFWMDGLDYPLVRYLNATIYERPEARAQDADRTGYSDARFSHVGLLPPAHDEHLDRERRTLLRYPWARTEAALEGLAATGGVTPHDDVILEYVNPATGRSVFPTIACCVQMIRPGIETAAHRHTGSAVYQAFEGHGTTFVGETEIEWEQGDFFVVPALEWHRHQNSHSERAILFSIQDFPALRALGLYREESSEGGAP
jgi:gentisate 1,2-dioxygenase